MNINISTNSDRANQFTYCQQCKYNGIPNQKIVTIFNRFRSEDEEGFIIDLTEYDYDPLGRERIHVHKYDKKLIERLVASVLNQAEASPNDDDDPNDNDKLRLRQQ